MFDADDYIKHIKQIVNELPGTIQHTLDTVSEIVQTNAKSSTLFKNRTGRLRSSIEVTKVSLFKNMIGTKVSYAGYVEFGNRPNGTGMYIYPKRAKFLKFTINGKTIFARRVRSHGPLPFLGNAVKLGESFIPDLFLEDIQRLINRT